MQRGELISDKELLEKALDVSCPPS